jgi:hypothetical protein
MPVPYTFGTATAAIPLSQLDSNFATAITLGNTAVYLGNTTTSIGNLTLTNVTISSGEVTTGNASVSGNVTLTGGTANGVAYLNTSKVLTTGSALVFDGTNLGIGTASPTRKLDVATAGTSYIRASNTTNSVNVDLYATTASGAIGTQSNHAFDFLTNNSVVGRFDTSGNLGVGTTSPNSKLEVTSTGASVTAALALSNYQGGADGYGSKISFRGQRGAPNIQVEYGYIETAMYNWAGTPYMNMSIMGGNLLVGTTSGDGSRLFVKNTTEAYTFYRASASTGAVAIGYWASDVYSTQGLVAYIRTNGGLSNYSANDTNLSDSRVKTDIQNAGSYLAKICAIPVRTFKYKNIENAENNLGVIAQEVEAVAPELVNTEGFGETPEDGVPLKSIYQTDLQYALMKCIQEMKSIIDDQAARIATLEAK